MTIFDEATAVRRVGEGRYEARPDPRFALVAPGGTAPPSVNGGVLVATVLRAVLDTSPHPYPVATSAHFLRVPQLQPAEVEVTWLRQGRTAATARAAVIQDGRAVLDTTVTTGNLPASPAANGELSWTGEPPQLPPFEECVSLGLWPGTVGPDGTAGYAAWSSPGTCAECQRAARCGSRPGAGTSAAAGSTRRPRSGTRRASWWRRAARSRGWAAAAASVTRPDPAAPAVSLRARS